MYGIFISEQQMLLLSLGTYRHFMYYTVIFCAAIERSFLYYRIYTGPNHWNYIMVMI